MDPASFGFGFICGIIVCAALVGLITWQGAEAIEDAEENPRELVVSRLTCQGVIHFTASLDGRPSSETRGNTAPEAVGSLVLSKPEEFDVTVRQIDQVR